MKHITRLFLLLSLVLWVFNGTPAPVSAQLENVIGGYSDISVGFTPLGHAGGGFFTSMSGDNRYVAYNNGIPLGSIILYDRQTNTHINLFQEAGIFPNGNSWGPSLSQDGRYIAFLSDATNLVPNDINGLIDIFVYDRQTKVFELVTVDSSENQMIPNPNLEGPFEYDTTWFPHISPDGRYVVFESNALNLVADDTNDVEDIFIRDRQAGTTTRLSVNMSGNQSDGRSASIPKISANGRYVVFTSDATDLVPNDTNGVYDVFVRDLQTNTTIRVSEGLGGIQTNGASGSGNISADGRYVVFQSDATNLIANDTNNKTDIFVKDTQTGTVIRVSVGPLGEESNQTSYNALISDDGRYVSFFSYADNWGLIPPADPPDMLSKHLYRHDIQTGATVLVTAYNDGTELYDSFTFFYNMSSDGRYVIFEWGGDDFFMKTGIPDENNSFEVYMRDVQNSTLHLISSNGGVAPVYRDIDGDSSGGAISDDGRYVAFLSQATNLVVGDTNGYTDVFVFDRLLGITTRASVATGGAQANGDSSQVAISGDGRYVAFISSATNLVSGDNNNSDDVFVYDRQTAQTTRVSLTNTGGQSNSAFIEEIAVSYDGRYVAFTSSASNLVANDTNGQMDVFVRDRVANTTTRVSVAHDGEQINGGIVYGIAMSNNGRYVAFVTSDSGVVTGDTNGVSDIFVRDTIANTTTRISVANGGVQANGASERPSISNDGVYIAFQSVATNLVGGDTNGFSDIFLHNRIANTTHLVSKSFSGGLTDGHSNYPLISGDGSYILFSSSATNIVDNPFHGNTYFVNALTSQVIYSDNVSAIDMSASGHVWIFNDYDKGTYDEDAFYDVIALNLHLPGKLPATTLIAPANAFNTTNFSVNFSWNAVPDATQYQIQIATDSGFTDIVHDHILAGTTYNYALSNSVTYYWRVRALNTLKFGLWSVSRQFTIQPLPAPTLIAPADMLVTTNTNITFSWNSVSGATQYQIQIATDSGFTNIIRDHSLASTSYNYTLPGQGRYYWRVRANGGTWSVVRYFDIPSPFIPLLLTPDNLATVGNAVDFSWSPVVDATEYQIQISTTNTFSTTLLNQTLTGTSYNYIFTQSGTRYWRVRARVSGTFQTWSEVRELNVQLVTTPSLIAPSNAFRTSNLNIAFSWSSVTGVTGYDIQIATDSAFTNVIHNHSLSATSYNYTLPQVRTYYWRVRAKINTRIGAWTASRQFTIAPTLNAPITMTLVENPTVNFSWLAMTGATQYQIQISRNSQFTQIENDQIVMTNSHTFELPYFSAYYWRVRVADYPDGAWSDVWRVNYDATPYTEGYVGILDISFLKVFFFYNRETFYVLRHNQELYEYDIYGNMVRQVHYNINLDAIMNYELIDLTPNGRFLMFQFRFNGSQQGSIISVPYIYDTQLNTLTPILPSNTYGEPLDLSDDGRYVLFWSNQQLSPQDTNIRVDLYLIDRQTGQISYISYNSVNTGLAMDGILSPDGRFVAYVYDEFTSGQYETGSLYLYNIQTGQSTRINKPNGSLIDAFPSLRFSPDGRYLMFVSRDSDIVPNDVNNVDDVFLYDFQTAEFSRISSGAYWERTNGYSGVGTFSSDGRFVTFRARIILNGIPTTGLFSYDRLTGHLSRLTEDANGFDGIISITHETNGGWFFQNNRFVVFPGFGSVPTLNSAGQEGIFLKVRVPTIIPADVPDVYSPAGAGTTNPNLAFTWEEIVDATRYDIEIATDPDFTSIIHTGSAIFTSYDYTLPANGTYYWRLRGANNLGGGAWTATITLVLGVAQNSGVDEQQLFNMAQPMLTNGMTFALFDVTPTGIITTTQFDDGEVVTGNIRMTVQNGLLLITVDGLSGGSTAQQSVFRDSMPAMMMNMLDEMLPDDYLAIEAVTMSDMGLDIGLVMPNP